MLAVIEVSSVFVSSLFGITLKTVFNLFENRLVDLFKEVCHRIIPF